MDVICIRTQIFLKMMFDHPTLDYLQNSICLFFVCFVALRPKPTAMVMAGQSVHITTLFLGKLEQAVNQYFVHIFSLVIDKQPFLNDSEEGRRMTVENITWLISI